MWGIGALSRTTGCHIETIRYYEKEGLIPAPPRSGGGHRLYGKEHKACLIFIRQARELGFSLEDVRELISLSKNEQRSCKDALSLVQRHLDSVQEKLSQLRVIQTSLEEMAMGCQSCCPNAKAPDCTIIDELARAVIQ